MATASNGPASGADDEAKGSWREQAVARRIDPARARAESRVQRFLNAATALMREANGTDFTVQEVVQKSGQSLRSFYQYFNSKQELLLALFEESVESAANELRGHVAKETEPLVQLQVFVVHYYKICRPARSGKGVGVSPAMVEFAQQLLTSHPAEAARAFAPIVSLFEEVLNRAVAAGVVRDNLNRARAAGVILEAIMFNAFSRTIGGIPSAAGDASAAEELFDLVLNGIAQR